MAWVAVAVGVGSAVAGIYGSKKAAKSADRNADSSLGFQMQQYNDWKKVYGPIEENLSKFYQDMDPETFAASGLKQFEEQYQYNMQQLDRSFAQQGIEGGAKASLEQQASLSAAETRASIRQQAPLQMAQAQQSFLTGNVVNPMAAGITQTYENRAQMYGNQAAMGYQAASQALTGAASAYAQKQQYDRLLNRAYPTLPSASQTSPYN